MKWKMKQICEPDESNYRRLTLEKYPKEEYVIFELPVREGKRGYQVFNGDKWLPLKIKEYKK